MRLSVAWKAAVLLAGLLVTARVAAAPTTQATAPPNPVLAFLGQESFETGGKQWLRYRYEVFNRAEYPNELFAASPELPPCGNNTKAARTWVDLYDQSGKRLNGFCALGSNSDLGKIWFAMEAGTVPPSWIYVELTDRKTNTKYKSNLAESTL